MVYITQLRITHVLIGYLFEKKQNRVIVHIIENVLINYLKCTCNMFFSILGMSKIFEIV